MAVELAAGRPVVATATRYLLQMLADAAPGHTVEVRVPPFGAVQCVEGPRHTRGTPPNVVEMVPAVWVAVARGFIGWREAVEAGVIHASGQRADLGSLLPLPGL
ncbi:MAG TPA: sterol carrier family protein [Microbacteriaceae bacterium]|nr:sterol carrier family protein [Microbacteriaceae bacterium]